MQTMLQIAQTRYTTKHYSGEALDAADVEALLEVLRLSPSAVNAQPWVFFVGSTEAQKAKILPAVLDFNRERVLKASHYVVFAIREDYGEAMFQKALEQEVADGRFKREDVIPGVDAGRRHFVGLHSGTKAELHAWETAQAYIAMGFLLFAAAGMGIDSTAIEGCEPEKIDEILGLPAQGLRAVAMVSLGKRAPDDSNASRPKSRFPREEVIRSVPV